MPPGDPQHEPPRPERAPAATPPRVHAAEEVPLPPPPETTHQPGEQPTPPPTRATRNPTTGWLLTLLAGAVVATAAWWTLTPLLTESSHPNWRHVESATEASGAAGAERLVCVTGGEENLTESLRLTRSERAAELTREVKQAAPEKAQELLQAAAAPEVTLSGELATSLPENTTLYRLLLSDCCDEDGDVVEVMANGVPVATVALTHQPVEVLVPLTRGANTLTVRAARDGRGGVTVGFTTSEGAYYAARMAVGQARTLEVVAR